MLQVMERPAGAVTLFLMRGNSFIMLKRHGSHGAGCWGLLGGGMDFGETIAEAAARECLEECGVVIDPATVRIGTVTNDRFPRDGKHFINVFVSADLPRRAEPRIMEPGKATDIGWFTVDSLPSPLFAPLHAFFRQSVLPPFHALEVGV
jgi:8-oxo-dGTP diphosphatase